jgi:hypothetical protein
MASLLSAMRPANVPGGRLWAAVLLVLALGVMGWALSFALARGPDPAPDPQAAPPSGAAAEATSAVPAGPPPSGLTADGTPVLPGADLVALAGRSVRGSAVTVLSVAADEGFWVGTGEADRVWLQLVGDGESPYSVREGDRIDIAGQVVAHGPDFAREIGVDPSEGAEQLTRQGAHLEVQQSELRVSS